MLQIQRRKEAAAGYREKSGSERQTSQRALEQREKRKHIRISLQM